jgi:RNA polymerase sigma-70 factor (ECF subfamily)
MSILDIGSPITYSGMQSGGISPGRVSDFLRSETCGNNQTFDRVLILEVSMDESRSAVSLTELACLHYPLVYRYAFRLCGSVEEAEDLTQQAFLTAHRRLDQLREPDAAKAWLCTILRNTFLTRVSLRRSARMIPLRAVAEPADEIPHDANFDSDELQQVLNELPEEFRTPLILFYFDEFTYREIAEQMNVPIGTVMSRLARGKTYLRRRLEMTQSSPSH